MNNHYVDFYIMCLCTEPAVMMMAISTFPYILDVVQISMVCINDDENNNKLKLTF